MKASSLSSWISIATATLLLTAWIVNAKPVYDYLVSIAADIGFVAFLAHAIFRRKFLIAWVQLLPWLGLALVISTSSRFAREELTLKLQVLASRSSTCDRSACMAERLRLPLTRIGASDGVVFQRYGASIFVRLYAKDGECRAITDELIGRGYADEWPCGSSNKGDGGN